MSFQKSVSLMGVIAFSAMSAMTVWLGFTDPEARTLTAFVCSYNLLFLRKYIKDFLTK